MATASSWKMSQEDTLTLTIPDATSLLISALTVTGYTPDDAKTITNHLIDAQLRGYAPTGLARALTIASRTINQKLPLVCSSSMELTRDRPSSAQLNAHGAIGYLAAHHATTLAISKAKSVGIGIVGVSDTFFAGMLSYYAEMCTREDLVCFICGSAGPWVAPYGSSTARFGTNPFCIGFPSSAASGQPVIWDIGTSKIIHAQVKLAQLMGEKLPPDTAYGPDGKPTRDPFKAMEGAMAVWGGHKGSGLAVAIQLLGALAGAPAYTRDTEGWGLLVMVVDPEMFRPVEEFKREVEGYSESIRGSRPLEGKEEVRMPFDRSWEIRERNRDGGVVHVERGVVEGLRKLVDGKDEGGK